MNPDEFSKSGRVIVPHGLGIAPGLEDGVGLDDLVLKGGLTLLPLAGGADGGKVGNDLKEDHHISFFGGVGALGSHLFGVFSLSGTGLAGNQDRLVVARIHHSDHELSSEWNVNV